ncbi:hypothetical protein CaLGV017 [Clostera anastomosis granulovirus A]|uniref:Uncharacterized protein n=1 Tax=Clostera anastomosis granulovirus A TaxID=1986289 RepID=U5KB33_9BBAC|nr:hypothetical protein CaLGV017 [Clostera anastomosis granulovirus Henan]AGQ20276.1 hypothetical protein CaLGV017 [Clostera anastomosis granulovirus Henan]
MTSVNITIGGQKIPTLHLNFKYFFGLSEIEDLFNVRSGCEYRDEIYRHADLIADGEHKEYVSDVGMTLLLEFNDIRYDRYCVLFIVADNVFQSRGSELETLRRIDKNVAIIRDYVTVSPI